MPVTTASSSAAPPQAGLLTGLIPITALLAIAHLSGWIEIPMGTALRPLTVLLIALHAWQSTGADTDRHRWVMAGLGASFVAECVMATPGGLVPALFVFALAQLCYLRAWTGRSRARMPLGPALLLHGVAVAWALALWWVRPLPVFIGLAVFMVMLGVASAQADTWWWRVRGTAQAATARRAALGSLCWMLADLLWTFALFVAWVPGAIAIAMTLYLLAQWLIASSIGERA